MSSTIHLTACERLELGTKQWHEVGNMVKQRWTFNPCEWNGEVYLCGGYSDTIETFDPRTYSFTLLPITLPDQQSTSVAYLLNHQLVILTWNYVNLLSLQATGELGMESNQHKGYGVWCNMNPVMDDSKEWLYVSSKGYCWKIKCDGSFRDRITN